MKLASEQAAEVATCRHVQAHCRSRQSRHTPVNPPEMRTPLRSSPASPNKKSSSQQLKRPARQNKRGENTSRAPRPPTAGAKATRHERANVPVSRKDRHPPSAGKQLPPRGRTTSPPSPDFPVVNVAIGSAGAGEESHPSSLPHIRQLAHHNKGLGKFRFRVCDLPFDRYPAGVPCLSQRTEKVGKVTVFYRWCKSVWDGGNMRVG